MRAGVLSIAVAAALTVGLAGAQAVPGQLDTSFGTNGITESNFGSDDIAYSVVVRKDGKIIVGGDANDGADFALTKNDANGIEHSQKITDLGGTDEEIRALDTDGKNATYAAGWTNAGGNYDFALVKYTKGLDLDKSFGTNGVVTTDFAGGRDQGRAIALQKDGKIIVAGVANWPSGDVALARYTRDGQLDPTFGTGGKVVLDLSGTGGYDDAVSVIAANGGGIVTAGTAYNAATSSFDWLVARFTAKGQLDSAFDGDGKLFLDFGSPGSADAAFGVAQYPGSRLVVAGTYSNGTLAAVERLNADGSPDLTFSGDGRELYGAVPTQHIAIDAISLFSGNRIAIAGRTDVNGDDDGLVVFMPPAGGVNGVAVTDLAGNDDEWRAITKYKNKVIVAGETDASTDDFILGRYFGQ
jgi:uncharacterized delta-60 repeat protein